MRVLKYSLTGIHPIWATFVTHVHYGIVSVFGRFRCRGQDRGCVFAPVLCVNLYLQQTGLVSATVPTIGLCPIGAGAQLCFANWGDVARYVGG